MKRYSVAPSSVRRNTVTSSFEDPSATEELERLEQETTLVLQEIDKNISRGNAIINDRLIPLIKEYSNDLKKVWDNAGFWKYFFEQSANVELDSYEEPIVNNTDVNTIANRNNLLYSSPEKDGQSKAPESPAKAGDVTPTWTTDQLKRQSSTPQVHKKPVFLPTTQYLDSKDESSIGIEVPKLSKDADTKVQTMRQSLDAYHKILISPRKNTPQTKRRSLVIQELLNSSPTLPEPPVLRSEFDAGENILTDAGRLSPVELPPELSPVKSPVKPNTMQRFPTTPKFSERLSGGLGSSSSAIKPLVYAVDDSDLQPPELNIPQKPTNNDFVDAEEGVIPPPDLQTIDLEPPNKKAKHANVFLELENSTMYHLMKEPTNGSSKSILHLFEEIANKLELPVKKGTEAEAKDIFKEGEGTHGGEENVKDDSTSHLDQSNDSRDLTENSTSDLGATLKERFKNLTNYGRTSN